MERKIPAAIAEPVTPVIVYSLANYKQKDLLYLFD